MKENFLLSCVLGAFASDMSEDVAFVTALVTSRVWSGRSGRRLLDCSEWLANGLGIAKCISISQMIIRWQWFAYSRQTECNCTGHVAVNGYVSTQVSDVSMERGHGLEE